MREIFAQMAPRLRRYAHALLGSWPVEPGRAGRRLRADQDADDLVHQALLGFWRAGFGPAGNRRAMRGAGVYPPPACICPDDSLKMALYRRVTALARQILAGSPGHPHDEEKKAASHTPPHAPWGEARALPRLSLELRALFALVALERLSYEQAAEVLDLSSDSVLPRLAVARAQLAGEISGQRRAHLVLAETDATHGAELAGSAVIEGDLHRFVDDSLDRARRDDVTLFLETHSDAALRVSEWRRNVARLRRAFEPLVHEPLPLSLNFFAPDQLLLTKGRGVKGRRGVFSGLVALLEASAGRPAPASRA
jgi:DNA-directed RNA polymerase specialized sigma24 family protein